MRYFVLDLAKQVIPCTEDQWALWRRVEPEAQRVARAVVGARIIETVFNGCPDSKFVTLCDDRTILATYDDHEDAIKGHRKIVQSLLPA